MVVNLRSWEGSVYVFPPQWDGCPFRFHLRNVAFFLKRATQPGLFKVHASVTVGFQDGNPNPPSDYF